MIFSKWTIPAAPKSICVSQGVHIVLDKKFYPSDHALMIPETSDGRVLFAVPWHNKVVVGTTDTPVDEASLEPRSAGKRDQFYSETASAYLTQKPNASRCAKRVCRTYVRWPRQSRANKKQKKFHAVIRSSFRLLNLFTILGGKWTTYRKMGEDMVDRIEKQLHWQHKKTETAQSAHSWLYRVGRLE